ncbi:MAG: hypothetical protein CL947_04275 [Epsilonproteobacteria bacterium]|nr:hypothetical protein [Campylobacterota bacterium]
MKKLLLLTSLLMASVNFYAASSCNTSCNKKTDCKKSCLPDHGHTFRRVENTFQNATPLYASQFNSNVTRNLDNEDKHGGFEVVVFGGKNTNREESACYYFPYGHSTYNVDGTIDKVATFGSVAALTNTVVSLENATGAAVNIPVAANSIQTITFGGSGTGNRNDLATFLGVSGDDSVVATVGKTTDITTTVESDPATFKFDNNKATNKILPWNFGITHAALFEPAGAESSTAVVGTGLLTNPEFKSTISPSYFFSHVGAGFALRYHFSDDKQGFFGSMSTSVEHVRSRICLNEVPGEDAKALTTDNFPAAANNDGASATQFRVSEAVADGVLNDNVTYNPAGTAVPAGATLQSSINAAYINSSGTPTGTFFPVAEDVTQQGYANTALSAPPTSMETAFEQAAWKYGKIGCEQTITRLADIELAIGYQWLCSDCASTNWYLGVVIPTGNKPCAEYVAPAVSGNGQHGGIMTGGQVELMLSENEDRTMWYRLDTNSRYLFRNTQKRSFDLHGNEWSRYMMVWENKEAFEASLTDAGNGIARRNFEPGINVFTHDMKVKPRFQTRINQAVYMQSDCFRAEMGWNIFARSKECVEFACPWDKAPAFAGSNYVLPGLNNARTIYNDATLSELSPSINSAVTADNYDDFAIVEADVNLDSAATPAALIHTPYLSLGYAWDSDCKPAVSMGASYEFSAGNRALNKWMLWGKCEFAF